MKRAPEQTDSFETDAGSPTVSVVIPCFNREHLVADAVESALAQGPVVREVICVDDGSTDGTAGVLERRATEYPSVTILSTGRQGANAARNRGLAAASCEYVQFLDSDDVLLPGKISRQVAVATDGNRHADLVTGGYFRLELDGRKVERAPFSGDPWRGLIFSHMGVTSSTLWHAEAVREAGGWSETLGSSQEYDLMFRVLQNGGPVSVCPVAAVLKREQEEAISRWGLKERTTFAALRVSILEYLEREGRLHGALRVDGLREVLHHIRIIAPDDIETANRMFERVRRGVGWHGLLAPRSRYLTAARMLGVRRVERLRRRVSSLRGVHRSGNR